MARPKHKAFTLFELVVVIAIIGIMIQMSRNLFSTTPQERKIYGETCINYVFGKLSNFTSDITYGRYSGFLLTGDLSPDYFLLTATGYLDSTRTQ
jgi:prepilin-type N-terminal cleavage/methylation domain-containing protein